MYVQCFKNKIPINKIKKQNENIWVDDLLSNKLSCYLFQLKICSDSASAIKREQGSAEKVDDKIQSIENELQIKLESVQKKADKINLMEQDIKQLELIIDSERGKYILYLKAPARLTLT